MQHSPAELATALEAFGQPHILVVGDLILDQYVYGDAERLSPEAPVPVVRERRRERQAGGAGNVAAFLTALGARCSLAGVVGQDDAGRAVVGILAQAGVNTELIMTAADRPTCTKTRFVGLAQHRHPQQMLRLDLEETEPIAAAARNELLSKIADSLPQVQALCIEDYNKGLLTDDLCQEIISMARKAGVAVLVDPASIRNYSRYRGATAITPNRTEAEAATGLRMNDVMVEAAALGKMLMGQLQLEACVLTLDRHGMYLLEKDKPGRMHTTRARNVYDVTGAGDMVLAMLALACACKASWSMAVDLGNIAGGLEVERFGCVPLSRGEILAELRRAQGSTAAKAAEVSWLAATLSEQRRQGRKIVFTNGVFDILHAGHVQYLQFARSQGDLLVVGVNSDDSVRRLKGSKRPINSLQDRLAVLAALQAVDYVVAFEDDTPQQLVEALQPDVLVKGADYENKPIAGADVVKQRGGQVVLAPLLAGRSTTAVVERSKL
ncbi:MAG: D-glycero-beta-D-manno-heptose 1-phosphate adenylyltransferase [Phycisphaerae bacterium]